MTRIRAAALGAASIGLVVSAADVARASEAIDVDVAIVFAADVSLSMDARERAFVRESHAAAIGSPAVLRAIERGAIGRIAATYVEFAWEARQKVGWTVIDGRATAAGFAAAIRAIDGGAESYTEISAALMLAIDLYATMPFRATSKVVDVVGDGADSALAWLRGAREVLISRGVVINGMPLVIDPSQPTVAVFYANEVAGGPGHFSLPVTDIDQMPEALRRKIVRELY
jgi:hypothetical protein